MLRVYLDQNHWISLTKARVGHKEGGRFDDVLVLLREAIDRGWVSCPLSMQHFMEVQNRSNFASRLQLAETMVELSRWHTIARQRDLVDAEIDRALNAAFGRPRIPRYVREFGIGTDHAMGREITAYEPPADAPLTPEQRSFMRQLGTHVKQMAILTGAPQGIEAPGYDPTAHRHVGEDFATEQERMRTIRREHGLDRGDRGRKAASIDVITREFQPAFDDALNLAGLTWDHLLALEEEGMERLLRSVPTVFVHRELRRLRHEASPKAWDKNDLVDLTALSSAIVYCDVVVTERLWTALVQRTNLQQRFGTTVVRDLKSLVPHLLGAAHAA